MPKYLITWEADMSQLPSDPKERAKVVAGMAGMVKQQITEGKTKDWGMFISGTSGYTVREGTAVEVYNDVQKYFPYISFDIQEVLSVDVVMESAKSMMS